MTPEEKAIEAVKSNADLRTNIISTSNAIPACYPAIEEAAEELADISARVSAKKCIEYAAAVELVKAAAIMDNLSSIIANMK